MSSMSPLLGGVFMLELPLVWYASGQARSGGSAAGSAIDLVSYLWLTLTLAATSAPFTWAVPG